MANTVTLYMDKQINYRESVSCKFSVKEDWLNSYLGNTDDDDCISSVSLSEPMSIEDFLMEYDAEAVYNDALDDNAIVDDIKECN